MGKSRIDEIDMGWNRHWIDALESLCGDAWDALKPSYWFTVYSLLGAISVGLILCARPIVRYWPAIATAFWEIYQCVAGLR